MANEGKLQQARTKLLAAQHETSPKAQIALYKEASQLYIQAANEIQDVLGKQTMVYLAQSALSEGLRIKSFLTASTSTSSQQLRPKSTTSTLPTSQLPTNMTKHDDSVSEYCKRIVMNVHLERIKGLQKVSEISSSFYSLLSFLFIRILFILIRSRKKSKQHPRIF